MLNMISTGRPLRVALGAVALLMPLVLVPAHAPSALARDANNLGNFRITDSSGAREVRLQINKSMIIELPEDAKDILVSNPKIANAIVRSARRIFVIGTGVGSTNVFFFDGQGRQIANVDLVIERDLDGLNRTLRRLYPGNNIKAEGVGDNVVVSGAVNSSSAAKTVIELAERFLGQIGANDVAAATVGASVASGGGATSGNGTTSKVVNALTILGKDQVQIKVVVAEVDRTATKQLGVDLVGAAQFGEGQQIIMASTNAFSVTGQALSGTGGISYSTPFSRANGYSPTSVKAMEQVGLIRTLAEPSLTAISGEEATFLAGGEYPVPTSKDAQGNVTVSFKPFGVGLNFTPIVLSEGRISLRVKTEVSELNSSAGFSTNGLSVPGLNVRRAESTVELPSGGTIVLAGLIRDDMRKIVNGFPGLRRLPVLGSLFSSRDYVSNQTELLVIVTPYIVNSVSRREIALPTDGVVSPSDSEAALLNRLNKVYGARPLPSDAQYRGRHGFIYE